MIKHFEDEQPELATVKSGEFRLYHEGQRLAVFKPQWKDKNGDCQMGKTVSIDLAANKGNQELIHVLKKAIEIVQGVF